VLVLIVEKIGVVDVKNVYKPSMFLQLAQLSQHLALAWQNLKLFEINYLYEHQEDRLAQQRGPVSSTLYTVLGHGTGKVDGCAEASEN